MAKGRLHEQWVPRRLASLASDRVTDGPHSRGARVSGPPLLLIAILIIVCKSWPPVAPAELAASVSVSERWLGLPATPRALALSGVIGDPWHASTPRSPGWPPLATPNDAMPGLCPNVVVYFSPLSLPGTARRLAVNRAYSGVSAEQQDKGVEGQLECSTESTFHRYFSLMVLFTDISR